MNLKKILQIAGCGAIACGAVGMYTNAAQAYNPCPQTSVTWATYVLCTDTDTGKNGKATGNNLSDGNKYASAEGVTYPNDWHTGNRRWLAEGLDANGIPRCSAATTGNTAYSAPCPQAGPTAVTKTRISAFNQSPP